MIDTFQYFTCLIDFFYISDKMAEIINEELIMKEIDIKGRRTQT